MLEINSYIEAKDKLDLYHNSRKMSDIQICPKCGKGGLEYIEYDGGKYRLWNNESFCFHRCKSE